MSSTNASVRTAPPPPAQPASKTRTRQRVALGGFLLALFVFALALRVYGINFGLPYAEEADEPLIMDIALKMLVSGDWNPHWFTYPTFFIYLQSFVTWLYFLWARAAGSVESLQQFSQVMYDFRYIPQPEVYVWGRALTALFGALTPLALYGAGATLYSRRVGAAAAVLLAVTYLHVQYSHYIRTDIPMTLFVTTTLWFAAVILKRGRLWAYLLAGASIGLAVASKYNAFLVALVVIAAHLSFVYEHAPVKGWRAFAAVGKHLPLVYSGLAALVTFVVLNPYALLDFASFWYWTRIVADYYVYIGPQLEGILRYHRYFQERGGFGEILTLLAYAGVILALVKHRPSDLVAVIFPIAYAPLVVAWEEIPIRSALPWTPFLALFAALALDWAVTLVARRVPALARFQVPLLAGGLILLCLAPVTKIIQADTAMARMTTRAVATVWANENLPRGARILSEARGIQTDPWFQLKPVSLTGVSAETLQAQGVDYVVAADDPPFATLRALDPRLIEVQAFPAHAPEEGPYLRILQVPLKPLPVELTSVSWNQPALAPGETAQLILHWRAAQALEENYDRFVRFIDAANETAAEISGLPRDGTSQTSRWVVGRMITDTQTLELPQAAGRYRVEVGFYRQGTNFALALQNAAGDIVRALPVGTVKVAPPPGGENESVSLETADEIFGETIHLSGYNVMPVESPRALRVTLEWQALAEMSTAYTRFVHILDAQGNLVAQDDNTPGGGRYPTTLWDRGERVTETLDIPLPDDLPPGKYPVRVGWYELASLQRLKTPKAGDNALLTEVEIK